MLPTECLLPCLAVLRELTLNYNCSVVLCTATQPAFGDADTFKTLALNPLELAPEPARLYEALRRVRLEHDGQLADDDLAARLAAHDQVLCVVNTRKHARNVFRLLAQARPGGVVHHLSTLMYPDHRLAKIKAIKKDLAQGRPCLVVSTQLIEAGVDVDFPVVYRAMAGLDSLVQAAGRCNREGRLTDLGVIHVFDFDQKQYRQPHSLKLPASEGRSCLRTCPPGQDPLSLERIGNFFENLYDLKKHGLDAANVLKELDKGASDVNLPFETVAGLFKYFYSPGQPLFVCLDEKMRAEILSGLRYAPNPGKFLRMAQPYTVQLYEPQLKRLEGKGIVSRNEVGLAVLEEPALYRDDVGLDIDIEHPTDPETMVY